MGAALQHNIVEMTAQSVTVARTSPRAAAAKSGASGFPLPSANSCRQPSGPGEQGGAAATLLDSPLRDGRFLFSFEGESKHVFPLIQDLRGRGYTRVPGAPHRVGQYAVTSIDKAAHLHRLEWIEPKPARAPKRRRAQGMA